MGSLGYAHRKTGDYKAALEAYDKALTLNPDYTEAIEYRGEVYLGLNRIDDARVAYYQLLSLSPKQAVELLGATKRWVKRQREGRNAGGQPRDSRSDGEMDRRERGGGLGRCARGKRFLVSLLPATSE